MTTFAGQMVEDLGMGRPSATWVRCDGSTYHPIAMHNAGILAPYNPLDYHRRCGWWAGAVGLGHFRIRVPLLDGWFVNLCDNPDDPDLDPDYFHVMRPPPGTR